MAIDWEIMLVTLVALLILIALAVVVVLYIRHWAARHEPQVDTLKEGRYFTRHLPEKVQSVHKQHQETTVQRKQKSLQRLKWVIISAFLALIFLVTLTSLYVNRDSLYAKVELTDEDKAQIIQTKHQWTKIYPETIPALSEQLDKLKKRGLVLLSHEKSTNNPTFDRLRKRASETWMTFGKQNKLAVMRCDWKKLKRCRQQFQGWVFVVLPDYWPRKGLDQLLSQGESVLLYDAPLQVVTKDPTNPFSLYGMDFTPAIDKSHNVLTLVGDQELTLGFDAGTIVDIESQSDFYRVTSDKPQALAIDSGHIAGATIQTRMVAKTVGKGRFVWLDFSPNQQDHDRARINTHYFNGVLAAVFRYLNKESYQALATWPAGREFAALIEEDTEDQYADAKRVVDYFAENKYPITWYILANEAQKNRALTRAMAASGEIACHGDHHQPFTKNDALTQHQRIALCRKALYEVTGQTVNSFRPPEEKYNDETLDALTNNTILHYIAEQGVDRFVPTIMQSTQTGKTLVSLPRMVSDDFVLWDAMEADQELSLRTTSQEIDYVKAVKGLYMFSFHTQFMANDANFYVIKALTQRLQKENTFFATTHDIANWWKVRTRLATGQQVETDEIQLFKPLMLHVDQHGNMSSIPVK